MDKKKVTSWGVSFASMAIFAGMMSYLGISNKTTTTTSQAQALTQNGSSSINYQLPNQQQSNNQTFSQDQSFNQQHGGFDTTTGGT